MRSFNIEDGLVKVIKELYNQTSSGFVFKGCVGEFFKSTIGVRQGCILSPVLFNIFLEKIMQESLIDHHISISIGGRSLCNLRCADDIDLLAGSSNELQELTEKIAIRAGAYGMEISSEKSKILVNTSAANKANITMNQLKLEELHKFKYLGAIISRDETCEPEIRIRIGSAMAAMTQLTKI